MQIRMRKLTGIATGVALAHMSVAFDFAPSKRAIVWKFGGVYIPSVRGSNATHPEFLVRMRSKA